MLLFSFHSYIILYFEKKNEIIVRYCYDLYQKDSNKNDKILLYLTSYLLLLVDWCRYYVLFLDEMKITCACGIINDPKYSLIGFYIPLVELLLQRRRVDSEWRKLIGRLSTVVIAKRFPVGYISILGDTVVTPYTGKQQKPYPREFVP